MAGVAVLALSLLALGALGQSPPSLTTDNGSIVLTVRRGANLTVRWVDESGAVVLSERLVGQADLSAAVAVANTSASAAVAQLQATMSVSVAAIVSNMAASLLQTVDARVSAAVTTLSTGVSALINSNAVSAQTALSTAQQSQSVSLSSAVAALVTPAQLTQSVSSAVGRAQNYSDTAVAAMVAGDGLNSALVTKSFLYSNINTLSTSVQAALTTKVDTGNLAVLDGKIVATVSSMLAFDSAPNALQAALAVKLTNSSTCGCVNPGTLTSLQVSLQSLLNISNVTLGCHARGLILDPATGLCQSSQIPNCGPTPPLPVGGAASCSGDTFFRATCPAGCRAGYIQSGQPLYTCSAQGTWVGNLTCTPAPCTQAHPALASGIVAAGSCVNTTSGSTCNLTCIAGYQALGNMTVGCSLGQYSALLGACRSTVDCHGWPDGVQSIRINGGASALSVRCSQNWTIIDFNRDATWASLFRGGRSVSVPGGNFIYAPTLETLQAQTTSQWRAWFLIPTTSNNQFAVSDDCQTCRNAGNVYYATGNYIGCYYFNRNCDMGTSLVCNQCVSNYQSVVTTGTCSNMERPPDNDYPWNLCSGNWWNNHPAVGMSGRHCVCYRPLLAVV